MANSMVGIYLSHKVVHGINLLYKCEILLGETILSGES